MSTFDHIKLIIASSLGIDAQLITEDMAIGDVEQWDSMGNMAIIAALEEKLGIEFPIEDLFELSSVSAIVNEIDKLR